MKKTIFLLAILLTIGLVSCSQDDDNGNSNGGPVTGKLYKMSFNVSEFEIDSTPLKNQTKAGKLRGDFLQYIIYKEDGSPLSTEILTSKDLTGMNDSTDSNIGFELELPVGKYHIAALTGRYYPIGYPLPTPADFETDFCTGNRTMVMYSGNAGLYYESLSFEVTESVSGNIASMTLKPMGSTLTINVTNPDVCDFPVNTGIVTYSISPAPSGFYLKSKDPKYSLSSSGFSTMGGDDGMLSIEAFQSGGKISFVTDKIKDATIKIQFYSANTPSAIGQLLGEQTIYTGDIERGKNIVLKGKLPEDSTPKNESSIKFNYVEMENVEIPFTE